MERQQYLIDTNAVIDFLGLKFSSKGMGFMGGVINDIPVISVVTKIEVLGFNAPEKEYNLLTSFMNDAEIIHLTEDIISATINLRRYHKTKLPDAIIAATAISQKLTLITRNVADFKNIPGLNIINAHSLTF